MSGHDSLKDAGHYENQRDVLQLSNDLAALPEQQGYLQCMSLPPATAAGGETQQPQHDIDPARLTHFFLRVSNKMRAHGDLSTLAQFDQASCRSALHCGTNPATTALSARIPDSTMHFMSTSFSVALTCNLICRWRRTLFALQLLECLQP